MPFLAIAALAAVFTAGCAGPEQKIGRGVSDSLEFTRLGDLNRSIEQTTVFDSPSAGYTAGTIHGLDLSVARTVMGAYELVTFPLPPYRPVLTSYVKPGPIYPESYKPGRMSLGRVRHRHLHGLQRRRRRAVPARQPVQNLRQLTVARIHLTDAPVVFPRRVLF